MNPWLDVPHAQGEGLSALVRIGEWDIEVRGDLETNRALFARNLDGRSTRGVYAYRISPVSLGHLTAVLPQTKALLAEHAPAWRDWWIAERQRHQQRRQNLYELTTTCGRGRGDGQLSLLGGGVLEDEIARVSALDGADQLHSFQRAGIAWARLALGRLIWNDDMGLGKTVQVLFYLQHEPACQRGLIVAPASVQLNWKIEADTWAPRFRVHTPSGSAALKKTLSGLGNSDLVVVTWGLIYRNREALIDASFDSVIADEAHNAQSITAQRTGALIRLCHQAERRVLPTGTKVRSRPRELWTLLHAIDPFHFDRFRVFGEQFCGPKDQQRRGGNTVRVYTGRSQLQELNVLVRGFANRRTKEQVLPQLPSKTIQLLHVPWQSRRLELENRKLRARLEALDEDNEESPLGLLVQLRKLSGQAKVPAAVDWIERAHHNEEPVVVFVYHHEVRQALEEALDKLGITYGTIAGDTSKTRRQSVKDLFQAGQLDVVIGTEAMKEGVTLTRARFTLHVERWWIPGDEDQAVDRIYRIGQERGVLAVFLHLAGSVDEDLVAVIEEKRKTLEAVNDRTPLTMAVLRRLRGIVA